VDWDTAGVAEGDHEVEAEARDGAGNSTTSSAVTVTARNEVEFALELLPHEEFPVPDSDASGNGSFSVNLASGAVSGSVSVTGFDPTFAHLHNGFAGVNGPVVIGLVQDDTDPLTWRAPDGAAFTQEQVDRLLAGRIYVNVHSDAFPGGEVRAQLLPECSVDWQNAY
jgi:hypothetical protein